MNKKISAYYAFLGMILAVQVVTTVVQGSLVVNHGKKVAQAETQMKELREEKNQLLSTIAKESSLISVTTTTNMDEYVTISSPLVISGTSAVAYSSF